MDSARPMKSGPILAPGVPVIQKNSNGEVAGGCGQTIPVDGSSPQSSPGGDSQLDPIVTKKTRTEISLEIQEDVAIRTDRIFVAECSECRSDVRMIPANAAAILAKITVLDIYRRVTAGELHFTESRLGLLYICCESLRNLRTAGTDEIAKAADLGE